MHVARWVWGGRSLPARMVRWILIPPSMVFRGAAVARVGAYRFCVLRSRSARAPTIAVGNLTVGGVGKTPISAWVAQHYSGLGLTPGIVLRGYGGDEAAVHRKLAREAIVVENPDRIDGASAAIADGAEVIVLDDAYQRLDIARDLNIAVVSAESEEMSGWTLPAGPWREGWSALRRADLVIITRKRVPMSTATSVEERVRMVASNCPVAVANLAVTGFHRLRSGSPVDLSKIVGANVVVAAGVADPGSFAHQCREFGAQVRLVDWNDHQQLTDRHLRELALLGQEADYTIVTEKDAGKLQDRWPEGFDEPIVAELSVLWERGGDVVECALNAVVGD